MSVVGGGEPDQVSGPFVEESFLGMEDYESLPSL